MTPESLPTSVDETAIRIQNLAKHYGLWSTPSARLQVPLLGMANRLTARHAPSLARKFNGRAHSLYHEFVALDDISFEIRKGESWGFIGVNGSGKSTLLKIISGNLRPTRGRVEVDGKVAILDYSSGLHGQFTGRENIYLKGAILGMSRAEIEAKIDRIIAFADIGEFINRPVKTYSSGMGARLGFAIIAHVDADIIITDEALAVGDAFFVQKCMAYIRKFIANGTFLFVSHAISDVVALCQKAVWLDKGRIRAIGSAKDVAEAYLEQHVVTQSRQYLEREGIADATPDQPTSAATASRVQAHISQPELSAAMNSRPPRVIRDPRQELLKHTQWRNDIEVPEFDTSVSGYGVGGAKIIQVTFEDEAGATLSWVIGAEMVRIRIAIVAERNLTSPIVGFQVRDRLGQVLFADNTYLATCRTPLAVRRGDRLSAEFSFQMPMLPVGEYVIRVAIANGAEADNAMLHVLDNALVLRSVTSGARHGLIGVPMLQVRMAVETPETTQ